MSRNYSPKTFLRKTPNALLKAYFGQKGHLAEINFDSLPETEIEPVVQALDSLDEKAKREVEAEFRQINDMACEQGVKVLIEEAGSPFHKLDWSQTFEDMGTHYGRAFWAFLNYPDVFKIALDLAYMDRAGSWKARFVGKGLVPAIEEPDKQRLAAALSEFYRKQGRGHHCKIDNYLRQAPERHCYFAYPEDYATTDISYDEMGQFTPQPRKPAFEVIFVYRPESGLLEVNAKGKKDDITRLQELFCQTILRLEKLPDNEGKRFDLSKLREREFSFVTDPKDGVDEVILTMLRLDLPGMGNRRITFEASSKNGGQPVHTLIEQALNKSKIPLDKITIAKAKIHFKFAAQNGYRGKTLTFEISAPDRWTLKDDPLDQIAKKYLEQWGLVNG